MNRIDFRGGGPTFRAFQGRWVGRVPAPLGCLLTLALCTLAIPAALIVGILSLIPAVRRRATAPLSAASPEARAREEALRRLVRAMALDDTFTADDARQAGTLVAGGATVDDLLTDALERRWIELRGDRLAVTRRGREAAEEFPIE